MNEMYAATVHTFFDNIYHIAMVSSDVKAIRYFKKKKKSMWSIHEGEPANCRLAHVEIFPDNSSQLTVVQPFALITVLYEEIESWQRKPDEKFW